MEATAEAADAKALRRRGLTLALLTFTYFFSYMDRQILGILQELIKKDLQLTDTQLGLLGGFAFAVFYATLGIPVARMADAGNRTPAIPPLSRQNAKLAPARRTVCLSMTWSENRFPLFGIML